MKEQFRQYHLLNILNAGQFPEIPIDVYLKKYFHAHKALGPKDRKFLSESIYGMIRWRGLLDHLSNFSASWQDRFEIFSNIDPINYLEDATIPLHRRLSCPQFLFDLLSKHYGEDKAIRLCLAFNEAAPTTIRINPLKISREELFEKWSKEFSIALTSYSMLGIHFQKKINFSALPDFKNGLFEVQDEGSQLIATLIDAKPGNLVLDYCAGAGGKTLAFAHKLDQKGQIYLHDIRPSALLNAKKRLKRAGIQNAQILPFDSTYKNCLKKKMNWVLLDVPCSGSGTLRRNPDLKWKLSLETIQRLREEQRKIFEQAIEYLHPEGRIVYATCSILPEENQEQLTYFQKHYSLAIDKPPFESLPEKNAMDGFFAAVLRRS